LQEAARVRPDAQRAADFLDKATQSFYQAHSLAQTHLERGIVEFHIGLTWLLLGASEDSKHWLAESHASLTHAAELLAQEADNVTVLPNKSTVAFASYLSPVGIGVLAAKVRKVRRAERASLVLARLVPVIEAASRAAAGTGTPGLPWYELEVAGEGWILRPTLPINPTADHRQPDQPE
jgi:hypothetical protein